MADLVARIRAERGRLDILVNDIWGGERLFEWNKAVWEHDLENGLRLLRLGIDTHLITAHHALPLLIERPGGLLVEVTDGTAAYNAEHYRLSPFYDLAKTAPIRMAWAHARDLAPHGATAVAITPGWLRSEMMLDAFGVTEATWRDALAEAAAFHHLRDPALHRPRHRRAGRRSRPRALVRAVAVERRRSPRPTASPTSTARGPDCWRYMVEVQDPGKPADAGCRSRCPPRSGCSTGRSRLQSASLTVAESRDL